MSNDYSQKGNFGMGGMHGGSFENLGTLAGVIENSQITNTIYAHNEKEDFIELDEKDFKTSLDYIYPEYYKHEETAEELSVKHILSQRVLLLDREIGDYTSLTWFADRLAKIMFSKHKFKILKCKKDRLNSLDIKILRKASNTSDKLLFIIENITLQEILPLKEISFFQKIQKKENLFLLCITKESIKSDWGEKSFKNYLLNTNDRISPELISKENFIQFYNKKLEYREKLICLGLTLFDGLAEDQFFAALEEVVARAWQKRDPSLKALDYCDIQNLYKEYFNFSDKQEQIQYIAPFKVIKPQIHRIDVSSVDIGNSELRIALFEAAWKRDSKYSLRRQVIAAISVLVVLVKESVTKSNFNWELYGDEEKSQNLRNAIARSLSDLGKVSISAIEAMQSALAQLGMNDDENIRDVAARAIATWYAYPEHKSKFFRTLESFYSLSSSLKKHYLEQARNNNSNQNKTLYKDNLGATIALSIYYAVEYAEANCLNTELIDWILELSTSKNLTVLNTLLNKTIVTATAFHLKQLYENKIIHKLLNQGLYFSFFIGSGIAKSFYKNQYQTVHLIINQWYEDYCQAKLPQKNKKSKNNIDANNDEVNVDEKALVIAFTYSFIDYEIFDGVFNINFVSCLENLFQLLILNSDSRVRKNILTSTLFTINKNQEKFKKYLDALIENLPKSRIDSIKGNIIEIILKNANEENINLILSNDEKIDPEEYFIFFRLIALAQEIKLDKDRKILKQTQAVNSLVKQIILNINVRQNNASKSNIWKIELLALQIAGASAFEILMNSIDSKLIESENIFDRSSDTIINFLAGGLLEIYLDQRSSLAPNSSTEFIKFENCEYPIWKKGKRPLTSIENYLIQWLKRSDKLATKELALYSLILFSKKRNIF
ncbi:hypothetical protein JJD41_16990 [Oxynema sp. CENA135]|uniref:hypothetical protein n=1 Tax=Oxynema sp. CENA135 TaxID=984206 RepID=UPI00190D4E89|nr:hypothetical protein [Oxynema sp. CENA135]MBK4731548.1 hypothetical protein [Oxynema sp. CENA135]